VGTVTIINIKRWHWTVNQKMEVDVEVAWITCNTHNRINDSERNISVVTWESDNPSRRTAMMASAIVSGLHVLNGPRSRKRRFCMTP